MIKCSVHRTYKALAKPDYFCKHCWLMWKFHKEHKQLIKQFRLLVNEAKKKEAPKRKYPKQ